MTDKEKEVAWLRRMVALEEDGLVSVGGWISEIEREIALSRSHWAAFLIGMASILDLGGTLNRSLYEEPLSSEEAARANAAAMAGAWEAVGEAFRTVLGDQERTTPAKPRRGRRGRLRRR